MSTVRITPRLEDDKVVLLFINSRTTDGKQWVEMFTQNDGSVEVDRAYVRKSTKPVHPFRLLDVLRAQIAFEKAYNVKTLLRERMKWSLK